MTSLENLKRESDIVQRAIDVKTKNNQGAEESMKLLKNYEKFLDSVSRMSEAEVKQLIADVNRYYDTAVFEPMLEPYRDSLRRATILNIESKRAPPSFGFDIR